MTEEEKKLYHKQKSHEHYLAHKKEYQETVWNFMRLT